MQLDMNLEFRGEISELSAKGDICSGCLLQQERSP